MQEIDRSEFEVKKSGSGVTGDLVMVRKDADGNPYKEPFSFEDYDHLEKGVVDFEVTGFQTQFEMPRAAKHMKPDQNGRMPPPTQTKTRLEFLVLSGPQAGKRWLGYFTWSVHEKSQLGQFVRRATGKEPNQNWIMLDVIGIQGSGYLRYSTNEKGEIKKDNDDHPYVDLSVDTVEQIENPDTLQPMKPSEQRAATGAKNDPRQFWSAFWAWAKPLGINNGADISRILKQDFDNNPDFDTPEKAYDALLPIVTRTAPF